MKRNSVAAKMRDELLRRKRLLLAHMKGDAPDAEEGKSLRGPDVTSRAFDDDTAFSLVEMESMELEEIEEALKKIKDGEFGVCEQCGGRISVERLKVIPYASLCIRCKREEEQYARAESHPVNRWSEIEDAPDEDRQGEPRGISERGRKVT